MEDNQNIILKAHVRNENGLHLKVASEISRACSELPCKVFLSCGGNVKADCRSPLQLLTLGASQTALLTVIIEGADASLAIKALEPFLSFIS